MATGQTTIPDRRRALAAWYLLWGARGLIGIFMSFGLVLLFALLILRGGADNVEDNLRQSRADVLALQPEAVEDENNAALDYQKAFAATVRFNGQYSDSPEYFANRSDGTYFSGPEVTTYLQQNAAAIQALLQAVEKPRCDWKLNYAQGYAILLPHLGPLRNSARLLAAYARECAHRGQHAEAARAIAAMYAMARHAERDPILICGLVAIAISAIADQAIESIVLWETPAAVADIEGYRKALWVGRNWRERVLRLMESEKVLALFTIDGLVDASQKKGATAAMAGMGYSTPGGAIFWYGADRRCCVAVMDELIAEIRAGKFSSDVPLESRIERHQSGPAIVASQLIPVLSRFEVSFARSEEQARLADAALAWLLFRAQLGRDPKSLEELVPEFLPAVPPDVFHDKALTFRIDPGGIREKPAIVSGKSSKKRTVPPSVTVLHHGMIRIYSLGQNGQDDQGLSDWGSSNEDYPRTRKYPDEEDDSSFRLPPLAKDKTEAKK